MTIDDVDEFTPWEESRSVLAREASEAARRAGALPAYQREWAAGRVGSGATDQASWSELPTLAKDDLVDAAVTRGPFGERLAVPVGDLAHVFVAPGPLYMPFTEADFVHMARSFEKALRACGIGPDDIVDQTAMYNWVIAATVMDRALSRIGCCVVPGGVGQSERHLDVIEALGVTAIVAFPSFLEHLLDTAAREGRKLPLRKAAVMGELRDPDAKKRIERTFGIQVREFYGVADVGAVAWECSAGHGMHLRDDVLVEFMEPGTRKIVVPTPEQPAELVVTDVRRSAMPIIRLRTGDTVADLDRRSCECGRTSPRFTRIVGRASEITKVKGMFVVPRTVEDLFRRESINRPFQLVVDKDSAGRDSLVLDIQGEPIPDPVGLQVKVEQALRVRLTLRFGAELSRGSPRLIDNRYKENAP